MSAAFRATTAQRWIFRGNITSKRGNNRFYKGRGAPSMGHIAQGTDKYVISVEKYAANTFVVPNLKGFRLKPYIAPQTERKKVARPDLIVKVNYLDKLAEERKLRVNRLISYQSMSLETLSAAAKTRRRQKIFELSAETRDLRSRAQVYHTLRRSIRELNRESTRAFVARRAKHEAQTAKILEELAARRAFFAASPDAKSADAPMLSAKAVKYKSFEAFTARKIAEAMKQRLVNRRTNQLKRQAAKVAVRAAI